MPKPVHLVIDVATFPPERHEATVRQRLCVSQWLKAAPPNWTITLGQVPGRERPPSGMMLWPRSGWGAGSDKHVPFVSDLMDVAISKGSSRTLCGFVNSDIYPAPHLFEDVNRLHEEGVDYILLHRTDVTEGELSGVVRSGNYRSKHLGKPANRAFSCDGVFMLPQIWLNDIRPTFPAFVTGEPWWDTAMIEELTSRRDLKEGKLGPDAALHIRHPMGWDRHTTHAERAHDLYKALRRSRHAKDRAVLR
jgi:hypothetical protein